MRRLAVVTTLALLPSVASAVPPDSPTELTIRVLSVFEGDTVLIRSPEGKVALIDSGPERGGRHLGYSLDKYNVDSIDLFILSSGSPGCAGGISHQVRKFSPSAFVAADTARPTPHHERAVKALLAAGATRITPGPDPIKIDLGSVSITVLPQPPADGDNDNNNSVGVRVAYGEFSMLLTGDSGPEERRWWMTNCPELVRDCTVLKLANHGKKDGCDEAWLDVVSPRLAVASMDYDRYGVTLRSSQNMLGRRGVGLLRTDTHGTIKLTSDGRMWRSRWKLDINSAKLPELTALPHITPKIAELIIENRPYKMIDEIDARHHLVTRAQLFDLVDYLETR